MTASANYRKDINGLRALAVLAVIAYHFNSKLLPGGFLGVDVFFVISGYVITGALHNSRSSNLTEFLTDFYARRIKRLMPALILVVLVGSVFLAFLGTWQYTSLGLRTGLTALFGFSNLFLLHQAVDYWGGVAEINPFTHTWSLGVEEQFYLVFPIFLWGFGFRKNAGDKSVTRTGVLLLLLATVCSAFSFYYLSHRAPALAFYGSPFRFWEIGVGALLYIYRLNSTHLKAVSSNVNAPIIEKGIAAHFTTVKQAPVVNALWKNEGVTTPFLFLLLICALSVPPEYLSTPIRTTVAVAATGLLLLTDRQDSYVRKLLCLPTVVYIGKISYSLYLWHWLVIVLGKWSIDIGPLAISLQIVAIALLSVLSYELVEKRIRYGQYTTNAGGIIKWGIFAAVIASALLVSLAVISRFVLNKNDLWLGARMVHANLSCHMPTWSKDPISDCLMPKNLQSKHIYVMGDSHSTNLIPSIMEAAGPRYEVRYLGDVALILSIFGAANDKSSVTCGGTVCSTNEFKSRLNFFRNHLKPGDLVVFSITRDILYSGEFDHRHRRSAVADHIEKLRGKLLQLSDVVSRQGGRLFLVDGLPKICSHKEYDLGKVLRPENPCQGSVAVSLQDREPLSKTYQAIADAGRATRIDPHPYLCHSDTCDSRLNNRLLYWDGSPHFLKSYPNPLTNMFVEQMVGLNADGDSGVVSK